MKTTLKYFSIPLLAVWLASGCTKFDASLNTDPTAPTIMSGTKLIANAEFYLPDISSNAYGVHYPQYLSNTSFTENSRYVTTNFNFSGLYAGPLMNLQEVINNSAKLLPDEGAPANQLAVAKILKAYFFWHMTDRWGALPYSEALRGSENFTPKYDSQQAIYNALFVLLDEANAAIVTGTIKNDIIYGGDMTKWKKLGNTIHLLMALRLSKVDPDKGRTEFNKAFANGIMTANADNLAYPHLSNTANQNYWYNSFTNLGRNWFALSKPLVDYMLPLGDPRLAVYGNKNNAGNYVGLEYGKAVANSGDANNVSLLGTSLRQQNSPVYLVTYAQALFAMAEAAKLGWITGGDATAQTNYERGIEFSFRQWNNNDVSTLATYLSNPEVAYTPATALRKIGYQRWLHLFLHGYEAWAEWRRTGYPTLVAAPGANGDRIPRREGYGTQERNINPANYNAAVAAFPYGGTDDLNARVWWDKP